MGNSVSDMYTWHDRRGVPKWESESVKMRNGYVCKARILLLGKHYHVLGDSETSGTIGLGRKGSFNEAKSAAETWLHQQGAT